MTPAGTPAPANSPHLTWPQLSSPRTPGPLTILTKLPDAPKSDKLSHSSSDWNFRNANWLLSAVRFHSPPTALSSSAGPENWLTSNLPAALNLPAARLLTWAWVSIGMQFALLFRSQQNPYIDDADGSYRITLASNQRPRLYYIRTGISYYLGRWPVPIPWSTWVMLQVDFWSGADLAGYPALIVNFADTFSGPWINRGAIYDPLDQHRTAAQNAVGLSLNTTALFLDDTEIWAPY